MPDAINPPDLNCPCPPPPESDGGTTDGGSGTPPTGGGLTDADFRDLTDDPDDETLSTGVLNSFAGGLRALAGNDTIVGSLSDEIINGNGGDDIISGGAGDDTLRGGQNRDRIDGGDGNDVVNGNLGEDIVIGGNGDDLVRGGQSNDLLDGSAGNDTLIGDFGRDLLNGGDGDDLFVLRTETSAASASEADLILDYENGDSIGLTGNIQENDLEFEAVTLNLVSDLNIVQNFTADDLTALANLSANQLDAEGTNITGTLIRVTDTGQVLGLVIGATEGELDFTQVPASVLAIG